MYIGPDPCRQHHSLYTYGSNNPINRIDPDGCDDNDLDALSFEAQEMGTNSEPSIEQIEQFDQSMAQQAKMNDLTLPFLM